MRSAEISHRCENPMTIGEARAAIDAIKGHADSVRAIVLDINRREGWAVLGYESWRACVAAEFGQHQSTLYRQLQAALIEESLGLPIGQIPAKQLRQLAPVPAEDRKAVWQDAGGGSDAIPTAKEVREATDRKLGRGPKPDRPKPQTRHVEPQPEDFSADDLYQGEPGDEPEPIKGQSIINGVLQDDDPRTAEERRRGTMPVGVVPVITINDPATFPPAPPPEREAGDQEPETVEEWLGTLPLYHRLANDPLKKFVNAAKLFYRLRPHREVFRHGAAEALKGLGHDNELAYYLKTYLQIGNPKNWRICPPTKEEGCDGIGQLPGIDEKCPKCFGRGFLCREAR